MGNQKTKKKWKQYKQQGYILDTCKWNTNRTIIDWARTNRITKTPIQNWQQQILSYQPWGGDLGSQRAVHQCRLPSLGGAIGQPLYHLDCDALLWCRATLIPVRRTAKVRCPLVDESHPRIIQSMKNNLSASRITSRVWHMYGCKFLLGLLTTKHYCSCSCDKHFYLSRISNTETMVEKQKHKYIFFNNQRAMPPVPDSAAISFASCSCVSMPMPRETATHHLCRSATTLQNWLNTVAGVWVEWGTLCLRNQ